MVTFAFKVFLIMYFPSCHYLNEKDNFLCMWLKFLLELWIVPLRVNLMSCVSWSLLMLFYVWKWDSPCLSWAWIPPGSVCCCKLAWPSTKVDSGCIFSRADSCFWNTSKLQFTTSGNNQLQHICAQWNLGQHLCQLQERLHFNFKASSHNWKPVTALYKSKSKILYVTLIGD